MTTNIPVGPRPPPAGVAPTEAVAPPPPPTKPAPVAQKAELIAPDAPVPATQEKAGAVASEVPLNQRLLAAMSAKPPVAIPGISEEIAGLSGKDKVKLGAELKKAGVSFEQLAEYLALDASAGVAVQTAAAFLPPQQRAAFTEKMTPKVDVLASARAHEPPTHATVNVHLRALHDAAAALQKTPNDEKAKAKWDEARTQIKNDVQLCVGDSTLLLAIGQGIEQAQAHGVCFGLEPKLSDPASTLGKRMQAAGIVAADIELYGATGQITPALQKAMDTFQINGDDPETTVLVTALNLRAAVQRARGDVKGASDLEARAKALPDVGHERQLARAGALADQGKTLQAIALFDRAGQYFAGRTGGKELAEAAFVAEATLLLAEASKMPRKNAVALERLSIAFERMKDVAGQDPLKRALLRCRLEVRSENEAISATVQDRMQLLKADEARAKVLLATSPLSAEQKAELVACASEYAQLASKLSADAQLQALAEADMNATAAALEQVNLANKEGNAKEAVARATADRTTATKAKATAAEYTAALQKAGHSLLDPMALLNEAAPLANTPVLKRAVQLAVADARAAHAASELRAAAASKQTYLVAEWHKDDAKSEAALKAYDAHIVAAGELVDQANTALQAADATPEAKGTLQLEQVLVTTRVAQAAFSVRSDTAVALLERAEKVGVGEDMIAAAAMYGKTVVDGPSVRFGGHSRFYRSRTAQDGVVLGKATVSLIGLADRHVPKTDQEGRTQIASWKSEVDFGPLAAAAKRRAVRDLTKLDDDIGHVKDALEGRTKGSAGLVMNHIMIGETWLASKVGLVDEAHDFRAEDQAEVAGQVDGFAQDGTALEHHYQDAFSVIARGDKADYAMRYRFAALLRDPRSNPGKWKAEVVAFMTELGSKNPQADANELEILLRNDPHMAVYQKAGRSSATVGLTKLYEDPDDTMSMYTKQLVELSSRYEGLASAHDEIETFKVKLCNAGVDAAAMYLVTLGIGGVIGAAAKQSTTVAALGNALNVLQRGAAAYGRLSVLGAEFSAGAFAFSAVEAGVGLGIQKLVGWSARKMGVQNEGLLFLIDSGAGALNLSIASKAAGLARATVLDGTQKALFSRLASAGVEVGKNFGMAYTLCAAPIVIEEMGVEPEYAHIIGDALFVLGTATIGGFVHANQVHLKDPKLESALEALIEGGEPPILDEAAYNQVVNALKLRLALEKVPEPELNGHDPAAVADYFARRAEYFKEVEKILAEDMPPEDAARMIEQQTKDANVGLLLGLEKQLEGEPVAKQTLNERLRKRQASEPTASDPSELQQNLQALHDQVAAQVATESPQVSKIRATRKALTQPADAATRAQQMAELEAAAANPNVTIVAMRPTSKSGINTSYIVELSNGLKAVWKPSAGEALGNIRTNLEEDHQGRREAAAYEVDKALGHMAGVPPTVYRSFGGESGSLMVFADALTPSAGKLQPGAKAPLQLFDQLIGNTDRHRGNYLVTEGGAIVPIDHGLAFPLKNGKQGDGNYDLGATRALTPEEKTALESMLGKRAEVGKELVQLGLDARAVNAMFERAKDMLTKGGTDKSWHK